MVSGTALGDPSASCPGRVREAVLRRCVAKVCCEAARCARCNLSVSGEPRHAQSGGFGLSRCHPCAMRRAAQRAGAADRDAASRSPAPRAFRAATSISLPCSIACTTWATRPAHRITVEQPRPDGMWMIVEPFAQDRLEQVLNPVGRIVYSASTFICTPASRAGRRHGPGRAGWQRSVSGRWLRGVGFRRFRRATETPFNLIYEARP
ncbi:hypothetical protein ACU4GD_06065 [Cupriavidus basilensis]